MAARNKLIKRFFRRHDDGSVYFVWNPSDELKEKIAHILDCAAYHWRRGELEQALEQAEVAVRIAPESPEANQAAMVYAIEGERKDKLLQLCERLPAVLTTTMPFPPLRAVALEWNGTENDGMMLIEKLSDKLRNHAYVLFAKAEIAYAKQQWDCAAEEFRRLYQAWGDFPYGHIHAARSLRAVGDAAQAQTLLEQRLQGQPRNAEVYFLMGLCYEDLNDSVRARQQYREALSIRPERADIQFRLGRLERRAKQYPAARQHLHYAFEQSSAERVEIARELLALSVETKLWEQAQSLLPYVFEATPTWEDVRLIVRALDEGAEMTDLQPLLAQSLSTNTSNCALLYLWGELAYRRQHYAEAQRALEAVVKMISRTEVWLTLARVYAERGDSSRALDAYTRVLELDRQHLTALKERCQLRIRLRQIAEALEDIEMAIVVSPDVGELYYLRALCQLELGEENRALESLTLALQRDQQLTDAWVLSSQLWRARGEYAQAIYALKQVIAMRPDDVAAHTAMAETQLAIGRVNAAKQHINHVLRHNPEKGEELYLMLGSSLERRNLFNQALDLYEDGLLHYPNSAEMRFRCGVTALKTGALHICSRQIDELVALDPIRAATLRDVYTVMLQSKRQPRV
jgi:tetratricopeptide (TPR) repeat protein